VPTSDAIPLYPKHFDGERFFNPDAPQARGLPDVLRAKLSGRPAPSPAFLPDVTPCRPPSRVGGRELRVTMVNHSTVLLQLDGLNILTDPHWSRRASPVPFAGPRRRRAPGICFEHLPPIDIVLISHNHYDHLDLFTLRRLTRNGASAYIVPSGVASLLRSHRIGPVHELDWGGALPVKSASVHSVPALHFSARGLFDRNRTLWCGYIIATPGGAIYFAGDTAFGDHFAAIRERFGQPRLALLPIGAYEPRWFMSSVHMDPEDAVRAHRILGAQNSVAIHHGTFQLADEAIDAPLRELRLHDPERSLMSLNNGQFVTIPESL